MLPTPEQQTMEEKEDAAAVVNDVLNHQLLITFYHFKNRKKITESLDFTGFPLYSS